MSQEQVLYEKMLRKVNYTLKLSGSYIDKEDVNRNKLQRFLVRRFYCINLLSIIIHLIGEGFFIVLGITTGSASLVQLTYTIPCVTLCLVGVGKSLFLISNGDLVTELLATISKLQAGSAKVVQSAELQEEMKKRAIILSTILRANDALYFFGLIAFGLGPLLVTWLIYKSTGVLEMQLPFLSEFPFDATDIRYWPYAYVHQIWVAIAVVSIVHGPDSFYSFSCTFLLIQFKTLQHDIHRVCPDDVDVRRRDVQAQFSNRLREIVIRHNELIRCVNLVENIYSKSTLGNIGVSAIVMCVCAFNVTILDAILMVPFVAFLVMWTLQVFTLCYFSDLLIESSTEVSNAVYHSKWYTTNAAMMKDLCFVLARAQKACKLTAMGYTDLNLRVFNKICSSAWSYFALLKTVNNK